MHPGRISELLVTGIGLSMGRLAANTGYLFGLEKVRQYERRGWASLLDRCHTTSSIILPLIQQWFNEAGLANGGYTFMTLIFQRIRLFSSAFWWVSTTGSPASRWNALCLVVDSRNLRFRGIGFVICSSYSKRFSYALGSPCSGSSSFSWMYVCLLLSTVDATSY